MSPHVGLKFVTKLLLLGRSIGQLKMFSSQKATVQQMLRGNLTTLQANHEHTTNFSHKITTKQCWQSQKWHQTRSNFYSVCLVYFKSLLSWSKVSPGCPEGEPLTEKFTAQSLHVTPALNPHIIKYCHKSFIQKHPRGTFVRINSQNNEYT